MLGGMAYSKNEYLPVRPNEILQGLFLAGKTGLKLKIDTVASALSYEADQSNGLVVIESSNTASAVSGINYGLSINADVRIINGFTVDELENIELLIKEWQDGGNLKYTELISIMYNQLDGIDFQKYEFVTFFTEGAPYSLAIKNMIPVSYVHLGYYPTLFIVDNIFFESLEAIGSAIVFSPLAFGTDEETDFVIDLLKKKDYWIKELVGKEVYAYNIDMHVKEYPYDILHICSHGGEVKGYSNTKDFVDRDGNNHTVEYDDVISFYPNPNRKQDLIKVEHKHIWRKFDGLVWKSKELKALNYPQYVFADMLKAVIERETPREKYKGIPKAIVPDSCAIMCDTFVYRVMFNMIAGFHNSPIIFNNTCWSWSGIADSFLNAGARGYIGTIWAIDNGVTKMSAESFYQNLFEDTVLNSLHKAIQCTKNTQSEDIYMYWGLHFSTVKKADSTKESRLNIADYLMQGFYGWRRRALGMSSGSAKDNSVELAEWNSEELRRNFQRESVEIMKRRK